MFKKIKISFLLLLIFAFLSPTSVMAISFNNGYIISDMDLIDNTTMNLADIQKFLERKNSKLATLKTKDYFGIERTAAEIIYNAANAYQINPQYILVTLQKEQSLIEDGTPTQKQIDWAMGYGVCDSCDPDDPALALFKGFGTQVDRSAKRNRWYIENSKNGWLKTYGQTYTIDGHNVYIVNQATANLYNYTPHIHGNYLFWKIWNSWFTQKYPDGSLLQAEGEPGVWLIESGLRRPFHTKGALLSRYDINKIIIVGKNEIDKYEIGRPIKFSNYSLLQTESGDVYLLVNDELRKFASNEVLRTIGYNPEEFEQVADSEIDNYQLGEEITMQSAYPAGALLQNNSTGGVFYVQDGKKHPIITRDIMEINYPRYSLTVVSPEELDKFKTQDSVKLKDGEIVKVAESASVFIIANGKKHPVASADVYENMGYKWENLRVVEEKTLSNLPLGSYIDLDYKK